MVKPIKIRKIKKPLWYLRPVIIVGSLFFTMFRKIKFKKRPDKNWCIDGEELDSDSLEYNIEIVENKPLARMLFANVAVGEAFPPELYQAVAEVLAYVYQVRNKVS